MVQARVTPRTRNPFTVKALSIFGVTWKWHVLNHAAKPIGADSHHQPLFGFGTGLCRTPYLPGCGRCVAHPSLPLRRMVSYQSHDVAVLGVQAEVFQGTSNSTGRRPCTGLRRRLSATTGGRAGSSSPRQEASGGADRRRCGDALILEVGVDSNSAAGWRPAARPGAAPCRSSSLPPVRGAQGVIHPAPLPVRPT